MGSFKHFHKESVNRCVTNQLEEEEMLQALQANRTQCRQPEEELRKPVGRKRREWVYTVHRLSNWEINLKNSNIIKGSVYCFHGAGPSPSLLLWVFLFAVGFQWCIDFFSKELHLTGVGKPFSIYDIQQYSHKGLCLIKKGKSFWIRCQHSVSGCQAPGLNRTMARRQPSSVLSICISLILLTSSVRTLNKKITFAKKKVEHVRERDNMQRVHIIFSER